MPAGMRALALASLVLAVATPSAAWAAGDETPFVGTEAAKRTISYGSSPLQTLDFYPAPRTAIGGAERRAPLVVFVHGGGWKRGDKDNATGRWKVPHFTANGQAFASINYRLVPDVGVEEQAADVAQALSALLKRADALGIDRSRVVLMGHSAGAHLVSLVGTDPRYLQGAGLALTDLAGVIALDGAAYDVPAQMQDGPRIMQRTYKQAFGVEAARQRALSPRFRPPRPMRPRSCCSTWTGPTEAASPRVSPPRFAMRGRP
jgi:arylformamidase